MDLLSNTDAAKQILKDIEAAEEAMKQSIRDAWVQSEQTTGEIKKMLAAERPMVAGQPTSSF